MKRYNNGSILLHWVIAFALAFELALGFAMPSGVAGFALFQFHKSLGITILALSLLRLAWRLAHPAPQPVGHGIPHQLARAVHVGFYLFMILAPLTGWAVVSTADIKVPTVIFGLVPLPHLPLWQGLGEIAENVHELLAWSGLTLLVLHIAGALRHEFLLGHQLLGRMAPGGSSRLALGLGGGVIVVGCAAFLAISGTAVPTPGVALTGDAAPRSAAGPISAAPSADASPLAPTDEASDTPEQAEPGPPPNWTIQPGGRLAFSVGNGAAGKIDGSFTRWSGAIAFDPDHPKSANIKITIDLASARVGDATQDSMLAGEDFFAAGRNGSAVFTARSASMDGVGRYSARGFLDLKGVRLPQMISFTLSGEGMTRKVKGSATIARAAFGVGSGPSAESLEPNVAVSFSFDAQGKGGSD